MSSSVDPGDARRSAPTILIDIKRIRFLIKMCYIEFHFGVYCVFARRAPRPPSALGAETHWRDTIYPLAERAK